MADASRLRLTREERSTITAAARLTGSEPAVAVAAALKRKRAAAEEATEPRGPLRTASKLLRLTPDEKKKIVRAAAMEKKPATDFIITSATERADAVFDRAKRAGK